MNRFVLFLLLFINCTCSQAALLVDNVAQELPTDIATPNMHIKYNYESTIKIPIHLQIIEPIKSEKNIYEGQKIRFKVTKSTAYKENIIAKEGDIIEATVSVIITPGMNGIPASIIFKDFQITENNNKGQFSENFEIFGQDRSWIVFPLKWALTFLPPTGSLTNFIIGGHASVKNKKKIKIYYYPEWD